jgi:hypothetical protein
MKIKPKEGKQLSGGEATLEPDYSQLYNSLAKDVIGEEFEDQAKEEEQTDENKEPAYILFDFRHGIQSWPDAAELIDDATADAIVDKSKQEAEEKAKKKKKDSEEKKDAGSGAAAPKTTATAGPANKGKGKTNTKVVKDEPKKPKIHDQTEFELLKDGTTALLIKPGFR